MDRAVVPQDRIPLGIGLGRRGQNLAVEPGLDDHRLAVALLVEPDSLRRKLKPGLVQRAKGGIFSASTVALVAHSPLERKIASRAGGPVDQVVRAAADRRDRPLAPGGKPQQARRQDGRAARATWQPKNQEPRTENQKRKTYRRRKSPLHLPFTPPLHPLTQKQPHPLGHSIGLAVEQQLVAAALEPGQLLLA